MSSFEYKPLRILQDFGYPEQGGDAQERQRVADAVVDGLWEIRLIRLLPSKARTESIQCELFHQIFKSAKGNYEALSYVWLDTNCLAGRNPSPCIVLDGQEFPITPNLFSALIRLRDKSQDRILWIDQICIDQTKNQEKSSQVDRMTLIYGFSKITVV